MLPLTAALGATGEINAFGIALKALTLWAGILVLAMLNGTLREAILIPKLGTATGFLVSGVLLSGLIFIVAVAWYPSSC